MATIDSTNALANEAQLERDLQRLLFKNPSAMRTGLRVIGVLIRNTSVEYCNIAPKKSQIIGEREKDDFRINSRGQIVTGGRRKARLKRERKAAGRASAEAILGKKQKRGVQANPGGLQRSIGIQKVEANDSEAFVEVSVPLNSEAGKYAHRIHDEGPHGTREWTKNGPGTDAKAALPRTKPGYVGDKFLVRAVADTTDDQIKILEDTVDRWFKSGGF